ncbi:MAG: glycosyltransferase family 2 protein [Deltaproteobacteria bacterium]|nr:glycosyltransferase family 2 protein [Deltaproteobacteria bacterium]
MEKISIYVLTFNNERTIERCLATLQWADELVVVDSHSTDGTLKICRQYTDRVYQRKWTNHQEQYQYAADLTTNRWVMFVDADEEVPPELAQEIREELGTNNGQWDGYIAHRRTYYLGRWIKYGGWYPDYEVRIYDRNKGRWEGGLHAKVKVDGRVKVLRNHYLHYTYRDISDQIQTIDRYSQVAAEDMFREGKRFSLINMLLNPPFRFLKEYIFKRGFLDGIPGLVITISTMFYVFIKYAKLWELQKGLKKDNGVRRDL